MADGAKGVGETVSGDAMTKAERFFFWLNRINAVAIFAAIILIVAFIVYEAVRWSPYTDDFGYQRDSGFDRHVDDFEGDILETGAGNTISYKITSETSEELKVDGVNLSFTDMETGKSILVLPDGSDQLIFSWDQVELSDGMSYAYVARVGNESDYDAGVLDLIVGRYSDLEQRTIAKRLRFIDGPQMIDQDTLSVIVWLEPERAEFWLIELATLSIVSKRPVSLPIPDPDSDNSVIFVD